MRTAFVPLATAALLSLAGSCAQVDEAGDAEDADVVLFEAMRLIPGDGSAPIERAALLVRDGRIEAIGAMSSIEAPAGASIVDLSGKTVMPLIVNVHGHVGYWKGASTGKEHFDRENVLDHLRRSLYYGVGVVRSLGTDRNGIEIAIRDDQRSGALDDPSLATLFSAGAGIVVPTEGDVNGGPFFATDVVHEATSPEDAREYVRELAAAGPDIVKIWVDDRGGTKAKMPPDIYRAVIDEAHAHGLQVIAHVYYLEDAKDLVRSGVDGLAHMVRAEPGIDDELVSLLREHDPISCSTMSIQKASVDGSGWLDDAALLETVGPDDIAAWRTRIDESSPEAVARARERVALLERSFEKLSDGGARVALCGDTGLSSQVPGFTEHRELEAMARAGMPPLDVIKAATEVGARHLGLDELGALAPGKRADFLVLEANPLDDMANTRRIADVYRAGRAIDRDELRAGFATH